MGPEEIHIYFWEGAPRPPKRKCDRPKNLEVFLVNFQLRYLAVVVVLVFVVPVVVFTFLLPFCQPNNSVYFADRNLINVIFKI